MIFFDAVWREAEGTDGAEQQASLLLLLLLLMALLPPRLLAEADSSRGRSHRRLKRGWIWKQLFVPEEDPTPRVIGQLKSDYDKGDSTVKYILSGEGAGDVFAIDQDTGQIRTLGKLDREQKAFYVLQAQALNRITLEPVEPESEFIIKVQDINDNKPRFKNTPYAASIPEMSPVGTMVTQVTATDADDPMLGNHAKLIYSILQGEPYFSVEPKTGIIMTSWPNMDREAREEYQVVVQVKDMMGLSGGYSASATVTVTLDDVNDNGPIFQHHLYSFAVMEDAAVGTTVGRVLARDGDTGINAMMSYSLEDDLEGSATFIILTDPDTQEGVLVLAKPLDFETKRRYVMAAEALNDHPDPRFLPLHEFSDRTTLKVVVEDVDEPPVFLQEPYEWKIPENSRPGTVVGYVTARDTDMVDSPIRYAIDKRSEGARAFRIDPHNGTVSLATALDRESLDWHNVTVTATETMQLHLSASAALSIKVLDVNDNAPRLDRHYQPFICEGTQAGELIQLLSALDPDDPTEGHHFYFSMIPDKHINPNFTIRDNQDNTAGVVARRSSFRRRDRSQYLLPVVVTDSGSPALSSTSTLTISVCSCQPEGHCPSSGVEALALSMGLSLQTLLGLLVSLITIAVLSVLLLILRRHHRKQHEAEAEVKELDLPETVSQKVLYYGDATRANFCAPAVVPLRRHPKRRDRRLRREEVRASIRLSMRQSRLIGPEDEAFRQFIADRLEEADGDPHAPPYDRLVMYAFEGTGSPTGSLSSLDSLDSLEVGAEEEQSKPVQRTSQVRLTPWYGGAEEDTVF